MSSDQLARVWTVALDGREFHVTIEERYSGMATGGLSRIAVPFWKITCKGYAPCLAARAVGAPSDDFIRELVEKEWPTMRRETEAV